MAFVCPICEYTTLIKCNFLRHQKRKRSCKSIKTQSANVNLESANVNLESANVNLESANVNLESANVNLQCEDCKKVFKKLYNLNQHRPICKGIQDSKTCPHCLKTFSCRQAKSKHVLKGKCTAVVKVNPTNDSANTPSTSNTIVNNNTNNTNCNNNINNSHNTTTTNNTIVLNAFGKENLEYIINNMDFMKSCLMDKEYGVIKCFKELHYNDDKPENQNIKKKTRKDDFVDVFDGKRWNIRMMDYVYSIVMNNIESVFTEFMDNVSESDDWEYLKKHIKIFCNRLSLVLDWDCENVKDKFHCREIKENEMKQMNQKMKKIIAETMYREST